MKRRREGFGSETEEGRSRGETEEGRGRGVKRRREGVGG